MFKIKLKHALKLLDGDVQLMSEHCKPISDVVESYDLLSILNKKYAPKVYKKLLNATVTGILVEYNVYKVYLADGILFKCSKCYVGVFNYE